MIENSDMEKATATELSMTELELREEAAIHFFEDGNICSTHASHG